jgi:hypothetical protein
MRPTAILAAFFALALAAPAFAQAPAGVPTRIRGTVEKLDGQKLMVKSRDGSNLTIDLAPNFAVRAVVKKTVADIKPGDFVASTSVKGPDGKYKAIELHIFLEAQKGVVPEGQQPWDLVPDSLMTNAIVTGVSSAPQGGMMKVKVKDKEFEVSVPPDTPVVTYAPGDTSLLKPGAAIFVIALKKPDGTLASNAVTAEKDGVKPPM